MINVTNARPTMIDLSNLHGIELEKARGFNIACVHWESYLNDNRQWVKNDKGKYVHCQIIDGKVFIDGAEYCLKDCCNQP